MSSLLWEHKDENLLAASEMFLAHAMGKKYRFLNIEEARRSIRGGLFISIYSATAAYNSTVDDVFNQDAVTFGDIPADGYATPDHKKAAQALLGTWVLLAHGKKPKSLPVNTDNGLPAQYGQEDGAGWLTIVRLVGTAIWAAAAAYVAAEYEDTVDRALKRGDVTDRLLASQASAVQVVHDHAQKEKEAGQSLPYTHEESAVLETLIEQQKLFASTPEAPKTPTKPGFFSGLGIGAVVVMGGLLWAMTRRN